MSLQHLASGDLIEQQLPAQQLSARPVEV